MTEQTKFYTETGICNQTCTLIIPRLQTVWVAELIHQPLWPLRLFHDALLVVLANGSGQFVIIHGWSVLAFSPQSCHTNRVLYLENALAAIQPANTGAMELWWGQQLLEELPQVYVWASTASRATGRNFGPTAATGCGLRFLLIFFCNMQNSLWSAKSTSNIQTKMLNMTCFTYGWIGADNLIFNCTIQIWSGENLYILLTTYKGQNCAVSIVSCYRLECLGFEPQWGDFPHPSRLTLGQPSLL